MRPSQDEIRKPSGGFIAFLMFLPGILMVVLPLAFQAHAKSLNPLNEIVQGLLLGAGIGFLISLYAASKLIKKKDPSSTFILKTFGLAILILLANTVAAFAGCSAIRIAS